MERDRLAAINLKSVIVMLNFYDILSRAPLLDEVKAIYPFQLFGVDGVSLWVFSVDKCKAHANELFHFLSSNERNRIHSLRHMERRSAYIAGHALLRILLSSVSARKVGPVEWYFEVNRHGKPRLSMPSEIKWRFNLSYTKEILAISLSQRYETGLDIESADSIVPGTIPWFLLSPSEVRVLHALPKEEQVSYFLKIWTLKEAISKCVGSGVSLAFSTLHIDIDPLRITITRGDGTLRTPPLLHHKEIRIGIDRFYLSIVAM